jgi:Arc/MetJ-type ribon-helix-helix transcriptional regulator
MDIEVHMLKTIQITLPESLLAGVDQMVRELHINRSSFARQAFEDALFRLRIEQMEREDAEGYARQPQDLEEIGGWERIQAPRDGWDVPVSEPGGVPCPEQEGTR